jgi:class 3 adenylate cyclase
MTKCTFCQYDQLDAGAAFCTNCGNRLIPETKQEVITDRLRFWGGELRLLSVVFVNFVGFDNFLRNQDTSDTMLYLREFLKEVEEIINRLGGTSNRIIPDSRVLGIFGAPKAHHEDALRAVRCAHQIKLWWLEKKRKKELLDDVDITIGINTGRAFFGYVLQESFFLTVIGDTINTAARLTEISPPNEILISKSTHDATKDYINAEHIGERSIKGRREKVSVYRLAALKEKPKAAIPQRFPIFGREVELQKLITLTQSIKASKAAFCTIGGQMGIGKTRLKEEFENYLLSDPSFNFIETHCSSESQTPYFPFKFLLRNYLNLLEFDGMDVVSEKIDRTLSEKGLSPVDIKGIRHLFITDLRRLRGEEMRVMNEEIYTAVKNVIRYECQKNPLVLIFEEFNRADANTRALVAYLATELKHEPLMFLMINVSSDFMSNLALETEEINLTPLSKEATNKLIRFLLTDVDAKLIDFIYEAAGGNPLFTIETIRNTRRTGVIKEISGRWHLEKEQRLQFLDDLYGVIMSALDSLPSDYRLIIDYASVIGYSFNFRILAGLFENPHLKDQLNYLVSEGYITLSKETQDPIYIFRHNLLKDGAYTVLPLKKRKEIHQQVAGLFETLYADQLSDFYENVGHHYLSCENFKKSANYFKLAGDKAKNLYALEQSFYFYNKVLAIKKEVDSAVASALARDILLQLTDLYEITGDIQKMEKIAEEGFNSAHRDKDVTTEALFTERHGYALLLLNEFERAEELLLAGVQKCKGDMVHILTILYSDLGALYANKYEYEKSILHYNLSWNTARTNDIKEGEIVCSLNLANLHERLGNYAQAQYYLKYGLEDLISPDDMRRTIEFEYATANINFHIWNLEQAQNMLLDTFTTSDTIGSTEIYVKSALALAHISSLNGNDRETRQYLKCADNKLSFFIRESLLAHIDLTKSQIFLQEKDLKKSRDYAASALNIAQKFKQREIECQCYILFSLADEESSLDYVEKALNIAELLKLPPLIAAALYRMSQIYLQQNDSENAQYYGSKALNLYNDMKSKLSDEDQHFYSQKPEFATLLEV